MKSSNYVSNVVLFGVASLLAVATVAYLMRPRIWVDDLDYEEIWKHVRG